MQRVNDGDPVTSTTIAEALELVTADLTNPTELNALGTAVPDWRLVRTNVAGSDEATLYRLDTSSDGVSAPYIMASATAGLRWVAIAGRYMNQGIGSAGAGLFAGNVGGLDVVAVSNVQAGGLVQALGVVRSFSSTAATIQLDRNAATGVFTGSLSPSNLTANRRWTFPDADITVSGSTGALTAGRVVFTAAGGILSSSANLTWDGTTLGVTGTATFSTPLASTSGGTGVNNAGTLTNASNTTITGGGTLALGGFTLTVPDTGTVNLLGTAQIITQTKTHTDAPIVLRNTNNTSAVSTPLIFERGDGSGNDAEVRLTGDTANGVASMAFRMQGADYFTMSGTGNTFLYPVIAPTATTSIPSVRMPHGTAPTVPTNGDLWTTTAGLYVRVNGATVGPLIDASGGGALATFYAKIDNSSATGINSATSATLNRMHVVTGTSADYTITISGLSPSTGDVLGFYVSDYTAADKLYTLDAGGTVKIAGRTRYLVLCHTNVALLRWDGTDWQPLVLSLTTPWIKLTTFLVSGTTLTATTTSPTLGGGTTYNNCYWSRSGGVMHVRYEYRQTTAGTAGTGSYLYSVPIGTIDTNQVTAETGATAFNVIATFGVGGGMLDRATNMSILAAGVYDSTKLRIAGSEGGWIIHGSTASAYSNAILRFHFFATLPMTNW